ncbi:MAG: hypothetical protein Salg2KO_10920 [Salibacteraceae bacterium]
MKTHEILLIEDDAAIRTTTQAMLNMHGYDVVTAKNGTTGIEAAMNGTSDLILCDINMPEKNGFDVLKAIRGNTRTCNTPFVMLTADTDSESILSALRAGANDYITKPFAPTNLFQTIEMRLQKGVGTELSRDVQNQLNDHQELSDSLNAAKRLQDQLMPKPDLLNENFTNASLIYRPKDVVSGDCLWMHNVDAISYVALFDCTGHGVPAAMLTLLCHDKLTAAVSHMKLKEPSAILDWVNREIHKFFCKDGLDANGMDVALCAYNRRANTMQFAGAKRPLFVHRAGKEPSIELSQISRTQLSVETGTLHEIKGQYPGIGSVWPENTRPGMDLEIQLYPNDTFYMSSDGFADQFGGKSGKKYLTKRFRELLIQSSSMDINAQMKYVENVLDDWQGDHSQTDDILLFGFQF